MENNNSNSSRNYNTKLSSSNIKNKNNNKNYIVINQKESLWQIFIKASQLMTLIDCLVLDRTQLP